MDTVDPKSYFLFLFTAAAIYFIPIAWDREYHLWRLFCALGAFYIFYFSVGYFLPAIVAHNRKSA